jgi:hypothetical protein
MDGMSVHAGHLLVFLAAWAVLSTSVAHAIATQKFSMRLSLIITTAVCILAVAVAGLMRE